MKVLQSILLLFSFLFILYVLLPVNKSNVIKDYLQYKKEITSSNYSKATFKDFERMFSKNNFKKCKYYDFCYNGDNNGRINFIYSCRGSVCIQNYVLELNDVNMLLSSKDYLKMRKFLKDLVALPEPEEIKNYFK